MNELLEEFDFNGVGAIDFEEFLLLMAEQMAKPGKYLSNNSPQEFISSCTDLYHHKYFDSQKMSLSAIRI